MNKKAVFNLALIAIAGSFGALLAGYEMGIISGAQMFIKQEWNLSAEYQGILVSIVMVGCFAGALINGALADKIGRKKIIGLIGLFYLIGCLLCSNAIDIKMLIASRVVNGVACGLANAVIPMYMSEISPVKTRGLFASLYQLAFTIGILLAYVIGFAFSGTSDWRSMFLFGTVPAIILLILYFFLSESPRWLLFKKRDEEAKLVFSKIEEEGEANKQIEEIKSSMADAQSNTNVSIKKWMLVPLFISIGLMFAQICTGINVIICYSSTIFQSVGFDNPSDAMKITVGIGIVNFLMTFVAMYLSDKVGRKPLLISGIILMAISMFAFAGANHFATALGDYSKWISVIAIVGFICSFAYSLGPVCWILISEIFPIEAKGVLTTFPVAANFIFCILLNALFPVMKESLGTTTTFSILGLVCVISFIFLVFCVPETKGISLEKIEENWKNGVKPCDF